MSSPQSPSASTNPTSTSSLLLKLHKLKNTNAILSTAVAERAMALESVQAHANRLAESSQLLASSNSALLQENARLKADLQDRTLQLVSCAAELSEVKKRAQENHDTVVALKRTLMRGSPLQKILDEALLEDVDPISMEAVTHIKRRLARDKETVRFLQSLQTSDFASEVSALDAENIRLKAAIDRVRDDGKSNGVLTMLKEQRDAAINEKNNMLAELKTYINLLKEGARDYGEWQRERNRVQAVPCESANANQKPHGRHDLVVMMSGVAVTQDRSKMLFNQQQVFNENIYPVIRDYDDDFFIEQWQELCNDISTWVHTGYDPGAHDGRRWLKKDWVEKQRGIYKKNQKDINLDDDPARARRAMNEAAEERDDEATKRRIYLQRVSRLGQIPRGMVAGRPSIPPPLSFDHYNQEDELVAIYTRENTLHSRFLTSEWPHLFDWTNWTGEDSRSMSLSPLSHSDENSQPTRRPPSTLGPSQQHQSLHQSRSDAGVVRARTLYIIGLVFRILHDEVFEGLRNFLHIQFPDPRLRWQHKQQAKRLFDREVDVHPYSALASERTSWQSRTIKQCRVLQAAPLTPPPGWVDIYKSRLDAMKAEPMASRRIFREVEDSKAWLPCNLRLRQDEFDVVNTVRAKVMKALFTLPTDPLYEDCREWRARVVNLIFDTVEPFRLWKTMSPSVRPATQIPTRRALKLELSRIVKKAFKLSITMRSQKNVYFTKMIRPHISFDKFDPDTMKDMIPPVIDATELIQNNVTRDQYIRNWLADCWPIRGSSDPHAEGLVLYTVTPALIERGLDRQDRTIVKHGVIANVLRKERAVVTTTSSLAAKAAPEQEEPQTTIPLFEEQAEAPDEPTIDNLAPISGWIEGWARNDLARSRIQGFHAWERRWGARDPYEAYEDPQAAKDLGYMAGLALDYGKSRVGLKRKAPEIS